MYISCDIHYKSGELRRKTVMALALAGTCWLLLQLPECYNSVWLTRDFKIVVCIAR